MGVWRSDDLTLAAVSALRPGQDVIGVFACTRKDRLMTRNGSPYLALELRDRTGTVPARAFQNADALAGRFERGDVVPRGRPGRAVPRRAGPRGLGDRARRALRGRRPGAASCPPPTGTWTSSTASSSTWPARSTTAATERCSIACWPTPSCARPGAAPPARRAGHHAYLGGLLEHTVAVATLAHETCQLHPRLNSDLLLTAALTHDLGRTREFTYGAEIGLTEEGRLLGHLVIGERILSPSGSGRLDARRAAGCSRCCTACSPTTGRPRRRAAGSPRAEALALFRLNALDAGVKGVLEHGLSD